MNLSREYVTTPLNTRLNWESAFFCHCYLNDKKAKLASWDDEFEESDGYGDEYGEGDVYEYEEDSMPDYEDGFFADTEIADVEYMQDQGDDFSLSLDY